MTSLSVVFRQQGRYNEAYKLSQQALKGKEEILCKTLYPPSAETSRITGGEKHPHTLLTLSNPAGVLDDQGKYERAEEIRG